jgi:hypothetical protein
VLEFVVFVALFVVAIAVVAIVVVRAWRRPAERRPESASELRARMTRRATR